MINSITFFRKVKFWRVDFRFFEILKLEGGRSHSGAFQGRKEKGLGSIRGKEILARHPGLFFERLSENCPGFFIFHIFLSESLLEQRHFVLHLNLVIPYFYKPVAHMVELADTLLWGGSAARHAGSSPAMRTTFSVENEGLLACLSPSYDKLFPTASLDKIPRPPSNNQAINSSDFRMQPRSLAG